MSTVNLMINPDDLEEEKKARKALQVRLDKFEAWMTERARFLRTQAEASFHAAAHREYRAKEAAVLECLAEFMKSNKD